VIAVFLVATFALFVFLGIVIYYMYKGVRSDSYNYDIRYLWHESGLTLKDMEFVRE
jgi:hypothetical protein